MCGLTLCRCLLFRSCFFWCRSFFLFIHIKSRSGFCVCLSRWYLTVSHISSVVSTMRLWYVSRLYRFKQNSLINVLQYVFRSKLLFHSEGTPTHIEWLRTYVKCNALLQHTILAHNTHTEEVKRTPRLISINDEFVFQNQSDEIIHEMHLSWMHNALVVLVLLFLLLLLNLSSTANNIKSFSCAAYAVV